MAFAVLLLSLSSLVLLHSRSEFLSQSMSEEAFYIHVNSPRHLLHQWVIFFLNLSYFNEFHDIIHESIKENPIADIYFVGYVAYLCLSKKFDADRVATSISIGTWILQATLSTVSWSIAISCWKPSELQRRHTELLEQSVWYLQFFLAWWQYTSQPCRLLKLLFEANKVNFTFLWLSWKYFMIK